MLVGERGPPATVAHDFVEPGWAERDQALAFARAALAASNGAPKKVVLTRSLPVATFQLDRSVY
jgi:hypothetical protein